MACSAGCGPTHDDGGPFCATASPTSRIAPGGGRAGPSSTAVLIAWAIVCIFPIYWTHHDQLQAGARCDAGQPGPVPGLRAGVARLEVPWPVTRHHRLRQHRPRRVHLALHQLAHRVGHVLGPRGLLGSLTGLRPVALRVPVRLYAQRGHLVLLHQPADPAPGRVGAAVPGAVQAARPHRHAPGPRAAVHPVSVLPIVIWIMRDQFLSIPTELEEAALVDGQGVWGAFARIILPIALPGMVAAFILSLVLTWNEYFFAALLTLEQRQDPAGDGGEPDRQPGHLVVDHGRHLVRGHPAAARRGRAARAVHRPGHGRRRDQGIASGLSRPRGQGSGGHAPGRWRRPARHAPRSRLPRSPCTSGRRPPRVSCPRRRARAPASARSRPPPRGRTDSRVPGREQRVDADPVERAGTRRVLGVVVAHRAVTPPARASLVLEGRKIAVRAASRNARSVGIPCAKFSVWWWIIPWMFRKPPRNSAVNDPRRTARSRWRRCGGCRCPRDLLRRGSRHRTGRAAGARPPVRDAPAPRKNEQLYENEQLYSRTVSSTCQAR